MKARYVTGWLVAYATGMGCAWGLPSVDNAVWGFVREGAGAGQAPGAATAQPSEDPLKDIAKDMKAAAHALSLMQTDPSVQAVQRQVVDQLDELIKSLDRTCSTCGGGGSGGSATPEQPLSDSRIVGGPGGTGELMAPRTGRKPWNELPPRERDKILQSRSEGFPPGYEVILERYYRSLAEENPVAEPDAAAPAEGVETPRP